MMRYIHIIFRKGSKMTKKQGSNYKQKSTVNPLIKGAGKDKSAGLWGDLNQLTQQCQTLSHTTSSKALQLVNSPEIVAAVADSVAFKEHGEILQRDIQQFADKLAKIQSKHTNRSGNINSQDNQLAAIMVAEQYQEWIDQFTSVVLPTVGNIMQMAGTALPEQERATLFTEMEG